MVPPEASLIVEAGEEARRPTILGRITSSRMSPTLGRAVCLAQVDAAHAAPGTRLTVHLPDGRRIAATVTEHLAQVDPEGTRLHAGEDATPEHRTTTPPTPRSPVVLPASRGIPSRESGDSASPSPTPACWPRSRSGPPHGGDVANALGTRFGRTVRDAHGALVVGSGPGEWLVLDAPGTASTLHGRLAELVAATGEFASVVDLTHGRALLRLVGRRSADLLAKVCAVDLADDTVPDGAALRTSVAALVTDLVRDDVGGVPSYLLHCERSSGQYLADALLDAGAEFGVRVDA